MEKNQYGNGSNYPVSTAHGNTDNYNQSYSCGLPQPQPPYNNYDNNGFSTAAVYPKEPQPDYSVSASAPSAPPTTDQLQPQFSPGISNDYYGSSPQPLTSTNAMPMPTYNTNYGFAANETGAANPSSGSGSGSATQSQGQQHPQPPNYYSRYLAGEIKPEDTYNNDNESNNRFLDFSRESIRKAFQRKVFALLFVQLLITCGILAIFNFVPALKSWGEAHPELIMGSGVLVLILALVTYCWEAARRASPFNLLLLVLVTLAYAVLASSISVFFKVEAVLYAAGLTGAVSFALILFSLQSKFRLTMWAGLCVITGTLALIGLTLYLLMWQKVIVDESNTLFLRLLLAFIASILLGFVMIYDMRRIARGDHPFRISPEEYVIGSLAVCVDILLLFIIILGFVALLLVRGSWIWYCWGTSEISDEEREERRQRRENYENDL